MIAMTKERETCTGLREGMIVSRQTQVCIWIRNKIVTKRGRRSDSPFFTSFVLQHDFSYSRYSVQFTLKQRAAKIMMERKRERDSESVTLLEAKHSYIGSFDIK